MDKVRVAVVRGGPSSEYDISLQSGAAVLEAIDRAQYEPIDIIISKSGQWLCAGYERFPEQHLSTADVVFIALHGEYGEDGEIQRLLERLGIRYTGSESYASSVAFNKMLTKDLMREHEVAMPPHFLVTNDSLGNIYETAQSISKLFGPSYIVKPVASGSSRGTMVVQNAALLPQALEDALSTYEQVLVEKRIVGKEASCCLIKQFRDTPLYLLPPIEIRLPTGHDFFDENIKYAAETEKVCPGNFSNDEKREIERVTKLVHEMLGLSQYSRSDFIVTDGNVYFLEVNNLPGLTPESLFPKALPAIGSSFDELINHLLADALEQPRR